MSEPAERHVPDIWLSGLVAALEAMAHAPAPPPATVAACRRHLLDVPPVTIGAPEAVPTPCDPPAPRRALAATH